jgi:sterol desaturase/sphingolipid hydroxylase (fatty acid hydroxylase superfamily)
MLFVLMINQEACQLLGSYCDAARTLYKVAIATAVRPTEEWVGLAGAIVVGALLYVLTSERTRPLSLAGCLRYIAPRSIYLHASSTTDYKYFVSQIVVQPLLATVLISASVIPLAAPIADALARVFGESPAIEPTWRTGAVYALLVLTAGDLGYFVFHYLAHKSSVLWEFHKVHHAAEVLNPATAYRNHPVDTIVQQVFVALAIAPINGAMAYLFDRPVTLSTSLATSVVIYGLNIATQLRHTHVWLSFGRVGNCILSSPALHQIHHSCEDRHLDTNFGRVLSVWDWAFGVLYNPREREEFALGLRRGEHHEYLSLRACYILPFVKAWRILSPARQPLTGRTIQNDFEPYTVHRDGLEEASGGVAVLLSTCALTPPPVSAGLNPASAKKRSQASDRDDSPLGGW